MKKNYMFLLSFLVFAFTIIPNANTQEFDWPDLGQALVIEPGTPGTINATINGDTSASGERLHQHYILKRGALYLYTAAINNVGWELMVTAEEGEGALPVIKALGPPEGADEAPRPFTAQGNIYLKGLNMSGWDQLGEPTDNATVRLNSDNIKGVVKDCILDFNRQNSFRTNNPGTRFYLENNLIFCQGEAARVDNGSALNARGNFSPEVIYRNNTIVNLTNVITENRQTKRYGKWIFDHNTIVNIAQLGSDFGRPDSLIFTNNLIINPMILGDAADGDRANFAEPRFAFTLDSNFVEQIVGEDTSMVFKAPYVNFDHNWFYIDPAVTAFLPDSSNPADEFLFDEQLSDIVAGNATVKIIKEGFTFDNYPVTADDYKSFIDDYYTVAAVPTELPGFELDPTTLDFGYSTSHAAYTGAKYGLPLGDLNWFGKVGIKDKLAQVSLKVYPNPVGDYFIISLKQKFDKVEIVNVLGQRVKLVSVSSGNEALIQSSDISNGLYFVRCFNGNKLIGTHKIMK
jgi:hypothetical protein